MLLSKSIKKIKDEFLVFDLVKDANFEVFSKATDVREEESIVFFDEELTRGDKYKFIDFVIKNKFKNISAVITTKAHLAYIEKRFDLGNIGILLCDYPRYAFFVIREMVIANDKRFKSSHRFKKINELSHIGNNVHIGKNVSVGSSTVINDNTIIEDGVSIGDNCSIGVPGYENVRKPNGLPFIVTHLGRTIIKKNTVIYSNVVVNKALFSYDETIVGENCIIDSNNYVGHGTKMGKNVTIAAGCTILGNCHIGSDVKIYSGSSIRNRIDIKDKTTIGMGSVVITSTEENEHVSGNFAINHEDNIQMWKKHKTKK